MTQTHYYLPIAYLPVSLSLADWQGLSYTNFSYSDLKAPSSIAPCENLSLSVTLTNTGSMESAEVVQAYLRWGKASHPTADLQLAAFTKTIVASGATATVTLTITPRQMAVLHNASTTESRYLDDAWANDTMVIPPVWVVEPLTLTVSVGGQQPGQAVSAPSNVLTASVQIKGEAKPIHECHADDGSATGGGASIY